MALLPILAVFNCSECPSSFRRLSDLRVHEDAIHKGLKPHVCDVCSKGFSVAGTLTVHKRIHADERPYPCHDCQQSFRQRSHLRKHKCPALEHVTMFEDADMQNDCTDNTVDFAAEIASGITGDAPIITGDAPIINGDAPTIDGQPPVFVCPETECGAVLGSYSAYRRHYLSLHATEERPYRCEPCNKAYKRKDEMRRHENTKKHLWKIDSVGHNHGNQENCGQL